jgi:hypothetical protein
VNEPTPNTREPSSETHWASPIETPAAVDRRVCAHDVPLNFQKQPCHVPVAPACQPHITLPLALQPFTRAFQPNQRNSPSVVAEPTCQRVGWTLHRLGP